LSDCDYDSTMSSVTPTRLSDRRRLGRFFNRNAYCRRPDLARQQEGHLSYRKGWEVRLVLKDEDEVWLVSNLIRRVGLNPGKTFQKGRKWIVPIYGQEAVESFQEWSDLVEKHG